MSGALGQRGDLANDNRRPALSLGLGAPPEPGRPPPPEGPPACARRTPEPAGARWARDGRNPPRRRDQNRNELGTPPEELTHDARNARDACHTGGGAPGARTHLRDGDDDEEDEEEEEEEEEEEGDGDSTPPQSEPAPAEWEQGGERPRGHGRSASRLFGARGGTASDDDSSAATLSQGSPAGSSPDDADPFWSRSPFAADADLPAGWLRVQDASGPYYWHVPTGTTQWEPPRGAGPRGAPGTPRAVGQPHGAPPQPAALSPQLAWTGFAPAERFGDGGFWKTPAAQEADDEAGAQDAEPPSPGLASPGRGVRGGRGAAVGAALPEEEEEEAPGCKRFAVRSLGWARVSEEELAPGRSSVAVGSRIRQLGLQPHGRPRRGAR
ncbi:LOW QUALITY PROTEIN: amyloid beta precursor protein binding family B member 1-like, partial [Pelecanus crispus]|uniref:LOW QUALITY PROTEIN: amyloid beta precursor protein binding family B member 1-like n=1 Tax=Pelecanus crispus TaxID=36300 RepID=UPI003F5D2F3C